MAKKKAFKAVDITGKEITSKIIGLIKKKICIIQMNVDGYKGCGNGYVEIDKQTGQVLKMAYTQNGRLIHEQNIFMSKEAGTILRETKNKLKVRANFSCHTACLF